MTEKSYHAGNLARMLGISRQTLYQARKHYPHLFIEKGKIGRTRLYEAKGIHKWMKIRNAELKRQGKLK